MINHQFWHGHDHDHFEALVILDCVPEEAAAANIPFHERYSSKVAALIKLMRKEQLSDEEVHLLGLRGAHASIDIVGVAGAAVAAADPP
jgi:cobalamin biosynthesis Co2+ chelatase CbiK